MSRELKGIAVAPGVAISTIVHFRSGLESIPMRSIREAEVPQETARFTQAVDKAAAALTRLRHEASQHMTGHDAAIFEAQLAILRDPGLKKEVVDLIRKDRINAEVALQRVVRSYEQVFETISEVSLRERAADIRDIGMQLLAALGEEDRKTVMAHCGDYIFAAEEFLPGDAMLVDRNRVRGIVTATGGKYSHGAILARSFGIPCVVGIEDLLQKVCTGTTAIVDGERGVLIADPEEDLLTRDRERIREMRALENRLLEVRSVPSRTPDGTEVRLFANVDGVRDLDTIAEQGFAGIGLFRTEFVFMERKEFPSEFEQQKVYEEGLRRLGGRPVVFRTLDIGGDKPLSYFRTPQERNPVLGWRGIRLTFGWPDFIYSQLRALLRASATGPARIMLPMVTSLEEVRRGREVIEELKLDLARAGSAFDARVPFGVMIEVPAAVLMLPEILQIVDFVSVGTNDLVQYLLAVDRDNPRVASLYDPFHPAVFRTLKQIADTCRAADRPVSICGEIAGDHSMTAALVGLGYRELSMAPVFMPRVKIMVAETDLTQCRQLATACLAGSTAADTRRLLREHVRATFRRRFPDANG